MKREDLVNEERLVKAASKGDTFAFEKLIMIYEKKIYNICLRLLKTPDEAYDAAQEVCIKIWKQLASFKGESKFNTWVYRVATNTCLDLLRQRKRRYENMFLTEEEEIQSDEKIMDHAMIWKDLSSHMAEKEVGEILWQGIQELKTDYRVIIVLRDIEGYAYEEIATFLEISVGTVKSRLSRARASLKKILEQNKEPYCSFFRHNKR